MIFRNSLKSIYRSFGKSALFTLIIFSLTLALGLATSVWVAVDQFLADCDEYYTTVGLFEYMGTEYPGDIIYDPRMDNALKSFNTSNITNDEATILWQTPSRAMGYVDGFWRTDTYMADSNLSVLVIGRVSYSEENHFYSAVVLDTLYSTKVDDNKLIYIDDVFGSFEPGHYYVVFGEAYMGYSPILHLRPASYNNKIALAEGVKIERILDITAEENSGEFYKLPENTIFSKIADTLNVTNNSVLVNSTDDIMSLLPFHQEELYFVDGRPFTQEEYKNGERVAVIPDLMAKRLGIGVGDDINLSVATSEFPGVYNSYWVDRGFSYQENFKVVGITNTVLDKSWYIYVPKAAGVPSSSFPIGYTVGYAVIDNNEAANFYSQMEPLLTDRFHLQIYDQGFSSVAIPYQTILRTAQIVTIVCAFVELAVIALFGYLFVYRQRETSETMMMLGSGKTRVCAYFLFSAATISIIAAAAGTISGYYLHDKIIAWVTKAAENVSLIDARYSNGNLTISRTLEFAPSIGWQLFTIVGIIVFSVVIISCLAFTISTFKRSKPSQRMPKGPKREHRTSRLPGGSLKYPLLSIARGNARTLVVPILAISIVIFFGQLANTSLRYNEQLEAIYDNTTIEGYYTDINGKQIGNLVLSAYDVANLYQSGRLGAFSISAGESYLFNGISRLADGTDMKVPLMLVPSNSYVRESLEATIGRGPLLTGTNNIRKSPEFYYADDITMSFLKGYDESILDPLAESQYENICIIPTSLMSEYSIHLGDTIRLVVNQVERNPIERISFYRHYDLKVVGSYEKQGVEDTIYTPLSLYFDPALIWRDISTKNEPLSDEEIDTLLSTSLKSANFNLTDSRDLIAFKNYLEDYGYSQVQEVGSVREFIVLKDAAFNGSIASIKQQMQYIDLLYPFLYTLVGIIAVIVSYLLVVSRKYEFATMRGLGAHQTRVFFSFFFEQAALCLLGLAVGLGIWYAIWGSFSRLHIILISGFVICYLIGSFISIMMMNRSKVLTILLDRE